MRHLKGQTVVQWLQKSPLLPVLPLVSLLATLCFPAIQAQTTTATILGSVWDDTQALVPGVTITVTNLDKGLIRTLITDDLGHYRASNLSLDSFRRKVS